MKTVTILKIIRDASSLQYHTSLIHHTECMANDEEKLCIAQRETTGLRRSFLNIAYRGQQIPGKILISCTSFTRSAPLWPCGRTRLLLIAAGERR